MMKTSTKYTVILTILLFSILILLQQNLNANSDNIFKNAAISMDKQGKVPIEIRLNEDRQISAVLFFEDYKQHFMVSDFNEFKSFKRFSDKIGQTHYRFKQFYKGIELAEVQFLLHEKNGSVFYAHGKLVHDLDLTVSPVLSESDALSFALQHINAESYMWENKKNEAFLKKEQNDQNATYYPKGELMISVGLKERKTENFRLAYRFDVYAQKPLGRYYVDVDAANGEIIGVLSRLYYDDVQGYGTTLYNGDVQIVVSDSNFYIPPPPPSYFHTNTWNSFGGSGESWWLADTTLGNEGGYGDSWYEALDTDPINLSGSGQTLKFFHRYSVEPPAGASSPYDGWDGMNVRISVDSGVTWNVLGNPSPAYTNASLFSFGFIHGEGPGIPGWTDQLYNWTGVTFDLSAYSGQTVQLRFALASDNYISTSLSGDPNWFGWQIDDIVVTSSAGTLYTNSGTSAGITAKNLVPEANIIAGKYRLRESGRGIGIATYDAKNQAGYQQAVDYVDSDSSFTDMNDRVGVSAHWAAEAIYDYFLSDHGRNSYDDAGARIISYTRYGNNFVSAFWGGGRMHFGDGDGSINGPLVALDVVGHEFTHGVTEFSSNLIYQGESGALNESFSDIFGILVEFDVEGINGDWLLGEDFGPYRRSMENPNSRNCPDTYMGTYWASTDPNEPDFGGVHTNSGVQDFWFYLLSEGGSGVNDNGDAFTVAGIGIDDAAQIAYRSLTVYLMPTSHYFDARQASINSALDLFGVNSNQVQAVTDAWFAVGVGNPYGIYALNASINKTYLIPGIDSLFLNAKVFNPNNLNVEVKSIIESLDQSISDTIQLFDDGVHQDSSAGDNLFGGTWPVPTGEKNYRVNVSTFSLDSGYYNILHDLSRFTTVGPVVVDSFSFNESIPNALYNLRLYLKNNGSSATATNVTLDVETADTNVIGITHFTQGFGDIEPGQIKSGVVARIATQSNPNNMNFGISISSEGWPFWSDSIRVTITGLAETESNIPKEHSLQQNYPNPFNPSTTIEFSLPKSGFVTLKVYNVLGEEVATLVSERLAAGRYEYDWDASSLASGVYLYTIKAAEFQEVRKMILMK